MRRNRRQRKAKSKEGCSGVTSLAILFGVFMFFNVESVFEVESAALACLAGPGPVEPSRVGTDRARRGGHVAGRDVPNLTS